MIEYQPAPSTGLERAAGALSHGSLLLGVPVLLPLAIWLVYPLLMGSSAYVRQQALQSLVFHLIATALAGLLFAGAVALGLLTAVAAALTDGGHVPSTWVGAFLAALAAMGVLLWASIVELVATIQALRGKPYALPIARRLIR